MELTTNGMPAGFADGIDDAGITVETDPTVTNWVKDGVSWAELKSQGMPPGFTDDVDNVGITVETDPQVDDNMINNYVPRWNSTTTQLVTGNIYNDPAGNVGIGTTGPGSQLEIGINAAFTGRRLRLLGYATTAGTDANFEIGDGSSVYWRMARNNRNNFQTDMSGTWGIIGGNVGIGTPSPQSALHISKGAGTSLILESDPSGAASYLKFSADAGPQTKAQIAGNKYGADGGTLTFSTLQGGALTAGMKIDSAGNVGIGTDNPTRRLTIQSVAGSINTPMLYLKQPDDSGYSFNLDDILTGRMYIKGVNSGYASDILTLDRTSGNVGIGTPAPAYKLDVNGDARISGPLYLGWGVGDFRIQTSTPDRESRHQLLALRAYSTHWPPWEIKDMTVLVPAYAGFRITDRTDTIVNFEFYNSGHLFLPRGYVIEGSDSRVKLNQQPLDYGLAQVLVLEPKRYDLTDLTSDDESGEIEEGKGNDIGFIAQEVYKIIPEAVRVPEDETSEMWGVSYSKIVPVLVKAVQEQQAQIEELKQEIQAMKSEI